MYACAQTHTTNANKVNRTNETRVPVYPPAGLDYSCSYLIQDISVSELDPHVGLLNFLFCFCGQLNNLSTFSWIRPSTPPFPSSSALGKRLMLFTSLSSHCGSPTPVCYLCGWGQWAAHYSWVIIPLWLQVEVTCMYVCAYEYVCVCMSICVCVWVFVCLFMSICVFVYEYLCVCLWVFVCVLNCVISWVLYRILRPFILAYRSILFFPHACNVEIAVLTGIGEWELVRWDMLGARDITPCLLLEFVILLLDTGSLPPENNFAPTSLPPPELRPLPFYHKVSSMLIWPLASLVLCLTVGVEYKEIEERGAEFESYRIFVSPPFSLLPPCARAECGLTMTTGSCTCC